MATRPFTASYRTSTAKQSLGIEAQREAVARFLDGGDRKLAGAFEEHPSGKNGARPALARAIDQCRRHGRSARGREAGSALPRRSQRHRAPEVGGVVRLRRHAGGGRFHRPHLCGDRPGQSQANLKPDPRPEGPGVTEKGSPMRLGNARIGAGEQTLKADAGAKRKADAYAETVIDEIRKRQAKGITTHEDLADRLTGKIETPRGAERWRATQVKRIVEPVGSSVSGGAATSHARPSRAAVPPMLHVSRALAPIFK